MMFNEAVTGSLEARLVAEAPDGVSVVRELPGGWLAIIAKHPRKRPLVNYLNRPPEVLMRCAVHVAENWAAQ